MTSVDDAFGCRGKALSVGGDPTLLSLRFWGAKDGGIDESSGSDSFSPDIADRARGEVRPKAVYLGSLVFVLGNELTASAFSSVARTLFDNCHADLCLISMDQTVGNCWYLHQKTRRGGLDSCIASRQMVDSCPCTAYIIGRHG